MKTKVNKKGRRKTHRTRPRKHKKLVGGMFFDIESNTKISDNGLFFIDRNDSEEEFLYIRTDFAEKHEEQNDDGRMGIIILSSVGDSKIGLARYLEEAPVFVYDDEYYKYNYVSQNTGQQGDFENDCLRFAETLAHGYAIGTDCGFYVRDGDKDDEYFIIGQDDYKNVELAMQFALDEYANPTRRDCYFITQKIGYEGDLAEGEEGCPHHAGFVIFTDGKTRITMEADASADLMSPVFNMYSVLPDSGQTFHDAWRDQYGGNTTVLRKLPEPFPCDDEMEEDI
jgi:hypothetical protein